MEISFNEDNISLNADSDSEPEYEDYFELNENFTHLTNLIRLQYFAYLKKIINENISEWTGNQSDGQSLQLTDEVIEECVAHYEERAVRYCMVVQLYRKYMLRIISKIKRETNSCKLLSKLKQCSLEVNTTNGNASAKADSAGEYNENAKSPTEDLKAAETKDNFYEKPSINNDCIKSNHRNENGPDNECYHNEIELGNNLMNVPSDDSNYSNNNHENFNGRKSEAVCNGSEDQNRSPHHTDGSYATLSLEEKIHRFEQSIKTSSQEHEFPRLPQKPLKRKQSLPSHHSHISRKKLSISQPLSPVSTSSDDEEPAGQPTLAQDTVVQDLESLFAEDKVSNDVDDIFGDCTTSDPAIESILREIENSKIPGCEDGQSKKPRSRSRASNTSSGSRKRKKHYRLQPITCDLRQSLWPCELHMWKRRLNETLCQLPDVSIRHHDRLRQRFNELFGEDSDDEFAPYSPSVELDDVVIASSMKRVAPTIVQCLMYPMRDGLIANRYLFKKLAKKLAQNIVSCDQYADEEYIKEYINMLFAMGRRVDSVLDIEDI